MRKPLHKHEKDPAGLARLRRPLMACAHLSQGHTLDARVIARSIAGAELEPSSGRDLAARERSCDRLPAMISALFMGRIMGRMPCASSHA